MLNLLGDVYGMPIIESKYCLKDKQVLTRMCRSKKKRIKKKWLKNPRNYRIGMEPACYRMEGKIITHPIIAERIRAAIELHSLNCTLDNIRMVI